MFIFDAKISKIHGRLNNVNIFNKNLPLRKDHICKSKLGVCMAVAIK